MLRRRRVLTVVMTMTRMQLQAILKLLEIQVGKNIFHFVFIARGQDELGAWLAGGMLSTLGYIETYVVSVMFCST